MNDPVPRTLPDAWTDAATDPKAGAAGKAPVAVVRPAGFRRRYAGYSLDFVAVAVIATLFTWSRLHAGWLLVSAGTTGLMGQIGQKLVDGMMSGTALPSLAGTVRHDRAIAAAADTLQSDLWRMCWPWLLAYALLAALWHIAGERSRWRGSPGKYLLGMRVVDVHDREPGLLQTLWRFVAGALSWLTFNLGHLLAAVPPHKRALHDYLAGTRVVVDAGTPTTLPAWTSAWLWLQVVVLVLGTGWVCARYYLALQASLGLA